MGTLPYLDVLKRTIEAAPTGELASNATLAGKPFAKESLGNAFKDACKPAGVMNKAAHGLRKGLVRSEGGRICCDFVGLSDYSEP